MKPDLRSVLLPALLASLAACSSGGGGGPGNTNVSQTIGQGGGTLTVTSGALAGLTLVIPPGALPGDVQITVADGTATPQNGIARVGPAALMGPAGTTFATPAALTLPFNSTLLPVGQTPNGIIVKRRVDPPAGSGQQIVTNE